MNELSHAEQLRLACLDRAIAYHAADDRSFPRQRDLIMETAKHFERFVGEVNSDHVAA